jgi:hypothetical protein
MPPFSICPKPGCRYVQDTMEDMGMDGEHFSVPPLYRCPECRSKMFYFCPWCKASIHRVPTELTPKCAWCGCNLYGVIFGANGASLPGRAKKAGA